MNRKRVNIAGVVFEQRGAMRPTRAMWVAQDCPQGSEAWEKVRIGRATASEFKKILTAKTCKVSTSATDYIDQIIGKLRARKPVDKWSGNANTDRGTAMEPEAREDFIRQTGMKVAEVGFVCREDRRSDGQIVLIIGCSPDGLVEDAYGEYVAGLEIKCPDADTHIQTLRARQMPDEHMQQVHGGMAVTGLDEWHFYSYCPGFRPFHAVIRRNDYTRALSDALDDFVIRYAAAYAEIVGQFAAPDGDEFPAPITQN